MTGLPPEESSKIQHTASGIGTGSPDDSGGVETEESQLPVAIQPAVSAAGAKKITQFGEGKRHADRWDRTPNQTGKGAIHVKTFHSKLTDDALVYMDQCVNEWLDSHPEYEVKFVSSSIGILTGKSKEPHLICQIWV